MKRILVVTAGLNKFCIDMNFVEGIHVDSKRVQDVLSELRSADAITGEMSADTFPISLRDVVSVNRKPGKDNQQLIVLADQDVRFGMFVDSVHKMPDIVDEAFQDTPFAFSSLCRECFPQAVVLGEEAIPVITPASIMKLANNKFNETQEG